jgi:hypothetical protein
MSSHPDLAYADPAHPFHDFPSPPATGRECDTITLDEFNRRRAARARQFNPSLPDSMPEETAGRKPGEWVNGRKQTRCKIVLASHSDVDKNSKMQVTHLGQSGSLEEGEA